MLAPIPSNASCAQLFVGSDDLGGHVQQCSVGYAAYGSSRTTEALMLTIQSCELLLQMFVLKLTISTLPKNFGKAGDIRSRMVLLCCDYFYAGGGTAGTLVGTLIT
jgi:hypothetical protein